MLDREQEACDEAGKDASLPQANMILFSLCFRIVILVFRLVTEGNRTEK